jgi:LEA14-like dessication related protein
MVQSANLHQNEIVKYLLLLWIISVGLFACQKPQAFDYRNVKNVKIEKLGFEKSTLSMDLVYYNPNAFGVDLRKVDADIYVDNHYLGKYQLDTLMHIQRRAEFILPSRIQVDMRGIFKNALTVLFNKEVLLHVKGTTRVGKAGFFKTIPFDYEARHKLEL